MVSPESMDDVAEKIIESPAASLVQDLTLAEARATLVHLDNEARDANLRIKKIGDAKGAIRRALLGGGVGSRSREEAPGPYGGE